MSSIYDFSDQIYDALIESSNNKVTMEDIKELNKYLNSFKYAGVINGKVYNDKDMDFSKYKTLSPEDMDKYKCGVCWDFANYEAIWFNKHNIPYTSYMFVMQLDPKDNSNIITHTFIIFKYDSKLYWFESSWFGHQGIKEVRDYNDVVKELIDRYDKKNNKPYDIYKYKAGRSLIGLTNGQFFNKATQNLLYTKKAVNESLSIDNSKSKDIQIIIDSLSDKDRAFMGMSKRYKLDDSKAVKEFVAYNGKIPVAYFMIDMQKDKTADVSLAVNPYYRHQGYGDKVARQGSSWIDSHIKEFKAVYWATKPNNKFSQKLAEKYGWKVVRDDKDWRTYSLKGTKKPINESAIINEDDILYNKDKFDSGVINLCFITGLSGSGKSTMSRDMQNDMIEVYQTDDLEAQWDFSDANLKEYGGLIYSFFIGPGKKYRLAQKDAMKLPEHDYEEPLVKDFVAYAKSYSKSHKDKKYVIEGVALFVYMKPQDFADYAFYIKGTSALMSAIRSAKRDATYDNGSDKKNPLGTRIKSFIKISTRKGRWKAYLNSDKKLDEFRRYFESKVK